MGKKKSSSSKPKSNQSFEQLVSKANQEALKPFIQQQMMGMYQYLQKNVNESLEMAFLRVEALESIVIEKLGYTEEDLNSKVVDLQNKIEGLESANDSEVKEGDTIRYELSTKKIADVDFSESSRQKLDKVAVEPFALSEEIEKPLIGMKVEESKEIEFGKDKDGKNTMIAKIKLNHIARKPAEEEKPVVEEVK